jgi:hypothetical protein
MSDSSPSFLYYFLPFAIAYLTFVLIYRFYFDPLAKFPGPKLAALTTWYEGYFDIVNKGSYIFEVGKMHEKYGLLNTLCLCFQLA